MDKTSERLRFLLRISETAEALGLSKSKTYAMVARREIPSIRVGDGSVRIPLADLLAWIDTQKEAAGLLAGRPATPLGTEVRHEQSRTPIQ